MAFHEDILKPIPKMKGVIGERFAEFQASCLEIRARITRLAKEAVGQDEEQKNEILADIKEQEMAFERDRRKFIAICQESGEMIITETTTLDDVCDGVV